MGIKEHEQVFDLLRKHGPELINDKEVCLSGTGAWKCLTVTNVETGEILIEKKFHKPKFDEIMSNPEYSSYIDDLLEVAMVKKMNSGELDIDHESYVEMEAVANELTEGA